MNKRKIFVKVTRENLPQVKDRYPYLYLEHGRLEIDGSSVKWINSDKDSFAIPCATINTLFLGPGTSITHEAVKILAASNCSVIWVGEDALIFYAVGQSPTANTCNFREQMFLAADAKKSEIVAHRMFSKRFKDVDISNKNVKEIMALEGFRVRELYQQMAKKYNIEWKGRICSFGLGDLTNQYLTAANSILYGIVSSVIHSMGYSPHIGFIHSGSPLPFVYDIADLYKEYFCIDLAFALTAAENTENYSKAKVSTEFRNRVIDCDLLGHMGDDIKYVLTGE